MKKVLTLSVIHQHPRVLLGMKKRGFGAGRWNGFGGKVEEGESIEAAARRELREEAGVEVEELEEVGIIDFEFQDDPILLEVHVFRGNVFAGKPRESDEMRPQWFNSDELPYGEMWPDDQYWFPLFLKGKKFRGHCLFGKGDVILEQEFTEVETSP